MLTQLYISQIYSLYIKYTHEILFGSANSFESYCFYSQESTSTHAQTDIRKFFLCLF